MLDVSTYILTFFLLLRGLTTPGLFRMKPLLSLLGRYALTLIAVAVATFVAFIFWKQYAQTPWTRDGRSWSRCGADCAGCFRAGNVAVRDNQWVNQGDVLYAIDPRWLKLAVLSAQADVEAKRHEMLMRQDAARRRALIKGVISGEDIQQTSSAARVAAANYQGALAALELAQQFISCYGARSGCRLRHASSASPGRLRHRRRDKGRRCRCPQFLGGGLFEETKLRHIRIGNAAQISLMEVRPAHHGACGEYWPGDR